MLTLESSVSNFSERTRARNSRRSILSAGKVVSGRVMEHRQVPLSSLEPLKLENGCQ